jgi:hypothetical protein
MRRLISLEEFSALIRYNGISSYVVYLIQSENFSDYGSELDVLFTALVFVFITLNKFQA